MNSKVFDEVSNFVGEQLWNFAEFQTKFGIMRVQGNKKGFLQDQGTENGRTLFKRPLEKHSGFWV